MKKHISLSRQRNINNFPVFLFDNKSIKPDMGMRET